MNAPSRKMLIALVKKLRANPNLFSARLTLDSIRRLIKKQQCVILLDEDLIYGFAAFWQTRREGYFEVGPIWIDESRRGKGHAGKLFVQVLDLLPNKAGTHVFLITKSEIVASIATSHGWASVENWQTSFWREVYEPLDGSSRTPHEQAQLFYCAR